MPYDRFMIAPLNTGLQNDLKPWLIPEDAFETLNNAYVFRGRIRKRFGSRLMNGATPLTTQQLTSRLRINIGTTDGAGNFGPFVVPGTVWKIGQLFSVSTGMFTVFQANGAMLATTGSGTFNTATGTVTITGAAALTSVYFYPTEPVMGLPTYEQRTIAQEKLYAFDTQFAYEFINGGWERLGTAIWTGDNTNFFWTENYRGILSSDRILWVTNFNSDGTVAGTDLIRYWDGTVWNAVPFNPQYLTGDNRIYTARIIIQFKGRLILMNTWESVNSAVTVTNFVNRVRFSQIGSPIEADAWIQPTQAYGKGGFIDLPTNESIVSAQILKDRLIIFCERSTWELVDTGNRLLPFVDQNINIELGVESPFSTVPFDKVILGIGNVGIHSCNALNVDRIDDKIPDEVFKIHDGSSGPERVYGIRDYFTEMVYWVFPDARSNPTYPNRVLVYNYKTGSWAFNDDTIVSFGYFFTQSSASGGITWSQATRTWESAHVPWGSGSTQSFFRQVVAGNHQGYVFIVDSEMGRNAPALQITAITITADVTLTIRDHNLLTGDYILIENVQGVTNLNGNIYYVNKVDNNTIDINSPFSTGTYTGGGTAARVSEIDILTKEYNFYVDEGRNFYIQKVDFFVDRTANGQILVDYYTSSSSQSSYQQAASSGTLLGSSILETSPYSTIPFEATQERLWHPVYLQGDGEFVQLNLYLNDDQIRDPNIALSNFELHAMTFYTIPTASRLE